MRGRDSSILLSAAAAVLVAVRACVRVGVPAYSSQYCLLWELSMETVSTAAAPLAPGGVCVSVLWCVCVAFKVPLRSAVVVIQQQLR